MQSMVEPINLVVLTHSPEPASRTVDILRNKGRLAYSTQFTSVNKFEQGIKSKPYEVVLLYPDFEERVETIERLLKAHLTYEVPIISVVDTLEETACTQHAIAGAFSVALNSNTELLSHAINMAVKHSRANRSVHYLTQKLDKLEDQNNQILNNSEDGIAFLIDGLHAYANETYLELFGFGDFSELAITSLLDILTVSDAATFKNQLRDLQKSKLDELAFDTTAVNDEARKLSVVLKPAVYEEEAAVQVIIEEMQQAEPVVNIQIPELQLDAAVEEDDGIIQRHEFLDHIDTQSSADDASFAPFSIIALALNQYDQHKKQLGIKNSEKLLVAMGERILETLDEGDLLCRFSDNGYTLATPKHKEADVRALCASIQGALSSTVFDIDVHTVNVTSSAAFGSISNDARNVQELLSAILHESSSHAGGDTHKDTVTQVNAKNDNLDEAGNQILTHIKANLESGFDTHYQPIIQLQGSSLPCYEVFIRMRNTETGDYIMPGEFLPVAAAANLSSKIDHRVILQACKAIQESSHDHLMLMIQLNVESIKSSNLLAVIHGAMKKYQTPKGSLTFILREKDAVNHLKLTHKLFKGLNSIGCLTAIKQYGSSKHTDHLLSNISFKFALLDGAISQSLESNESNVSLLTDHVSALHQNKVKVIAPFIESAASLPYLWQTGVDLIQGDYIQSPSDKMQYNFNA